MDLLSIGVFSCDSSRSATPANGFRLRFFVRKRCEYDLFDAFSLFVTDNRALVRLKIYKMAVRRLYFFLETIAENMIGFIFVV